MTKKTVKEDLNLLTKFNPEGKATKDAAKKGLGYVGFDRYEDPSVGQVTHISQNDKLVPYNKAIRTKQFQASGTDNLGDYASLISQDVEELNNILIAAYPPEKFDDEELDAIFDFTSSSFTEINQKLAGLPTGIAATKIEPENVEDRFPLIVDALDSAAKKSRAPVDFFIYVSLGADINLDTIGPGISFRFKGFKVGSINPINAIDGDSKERIGPNGRQQIALLQIAVKKNSRGMYISDYSAMPEEGEFMLPRGVKINVVGGPTKLVASDALTQNLNLEIVFYDCVLKN